MVPSCSASLGFRRYVDQLESLAQGDAVPGFVEWRRRLVASLDGEPGRVLRREEEYERLRRQGAYFTGAKMATRLAKTLAVASDSRRDYFDPTCGAGDLLLAIARKLPVADTLEGTIADWGERLAGFDISAEFVRAAKARLALLAAKRCGVRPAAANVVISCTFRRIVEADFLSDAERAPLADVVVMNPPFGYTGANDDCAWARGRVSAAALFAEKAIRNSREGAQIAAILPDVLRSGSRYKRWREMIGTLGSIHRERPLGVFDRWADVDVYLLDYRVGRGENAEAVVSAAVRRRTGIGKRFTIHVGPVVPHRHAEVGPRAPYIHARSLPPWSERTHIAESREFSGRLFRPPFVVVRRTSRPNDRKRAVASLVLSNEPVAVENHLLVLIPNDGTIATCRSLMLRLRSDKTDGWINNRLRCRHLTTAVLSDLPWWSKP